MVAAGGERTLEAVYRRTRAALEAANVPDAAFDAELLVRAAAGRDRRVEPEAPLAPEGAERLAALMQRRCAREPLQYLLGEWDFMDFTLKVGPGVLIPRADTECVCEAAVEAARSWRAPAVLDLCSGSGALAIGVARRVPDAAVTAVELSETACTYLAANALALAPRVRCVRADVFGYEARLAPGSVQVLVCNPPYVSEAEMETLAPELACEPREALCPGADSLRFYRHLATAYRRCLAPGGTLVAEIGAAQGAQVSLLLRAAGWSGVCVRPDAAGLPRCVCARQGGTA